MKRLFEAGRLPRPQIWVQNRDLKFFSGDSVFKAKSFPTEMSLPPVPDGDSLWYGPEMASRKKEWQYILHREEIAEVEKAVASVLARNTDIADLTPDAFPLPTLAPTLLRLLGDLQNGRGFALLKGFPVSKWTRLEQATAFLGLGCHLGNFRSQNAKGHILGHVKDLGFSSKDPGVRVYQTHERQTFHTDSCDVVGLMCIQPARRGGVSALVSTATLYAEIKQRRPDLAIELFKPVATDRRGEVPQGMKPYFMIPVLSWHAGYVTGIYQRQYIDSAQRFPDAPRLSATTVSALDLWDRLADDPNHHLSMALEPGDVQLVYNHAVLHDRTAFTDWPDPARRRHLLRLWLATPGARPLPACFAERYLHMPLRLPHPQISPPPHSLHRLVILPCPQIPLPTNSLH